MQSYPSFNARLFGLSLFVSENSRIFQGDAEPQPVFPRLFDARVEKNVSSCT